MEIPGEMRIREMKKLAPVALAFALSGCAAEKTALESLITETTPARERLLSEYQQRPIGYPMYENKMSFLGIDLGRVGWYGWYGDEKSHVSKESFFTLKVESNIHTGKTVSYLTSHLAYLKKTYNVTSRDLSSLEHFLLQSSRDISRIRIDARYKKGQKEGAVMVYENEDSSLKDSILVPTSVILSIFHYSIPQITGKSYFFGRILDHYVIKCEGKLDFFKE